jgi:hypothetical protein
LTEHLDLALPDLPDPRTREDKARWRRLRAELEAAAAAAPLDAATFPQCASALSGGDEMLRTALARRLGHPVALQQQPPTGARARGNAGRYALVALVLRSGLTPTARIEQFRGAVTQLRSAGLLVVVATLVHDETIDRGHPVPSVGQALEELSRASGGALSEQRVSTFRWPGERFVRGVVLTFRLLRNEDAARD